MTVQVCFSVLFGHFTPEKCLWKYIRLIFLKKYFLQIDAKEHGSGGQGGAEADAGTGPGECSAESEPTWVNCLVGRIFWDFLWEKYWADQVAHKIQKKLSKIKVMVYENVCRLGVGFFLFVF